MFFDVLISLVPSFLVFLSPWDDAFLFRVPPLRIFSPTPFPLLPALQPKLRHFPPLCRFAFIYCFFLSCLTSLCRTHFLSVRLLPLFGSVFLLECAKFIFSWVFRSLFSSIINCDFSLSPLVFFSLTLAVTLSLFSDFYLTWLCRPVLYFLLLTLPYGFFPLALLMVMTFSFFFFFFFARSLLLFLPCGLFSFDVSFSFTNAAAFRSFLLFPPPLFRFVCLVLCPSYWFSFSFWIPFAACVLLSGGIFPPLIEVPT